MILYRAHTCLHAPLHVLQHREAGVDQFKVTSGKLKDQSVFNDFENLGATLHLTRIQVLPVTLGQALGDIGVVEQRLFVQKVKNVHGMVHAFMDAGEIDDIVLMERVLRFRRRCIDC